MSASTALSAAAALGGTAPAVAALTVGAALSVVDGAAALVVDVVALERAAVGVAAVAGSARVEATWGSGGALALGAVLAVGALALGAVLAVGALVSSAARASLTQCAASAPSNASAHQRALISDPPRRKLRERAYCVHNGLTVPK